MEGIKIPIANEVAEDDAALQQLVRNNWVIQPRLSRLSAARATILVVGTGQSPTSKRACRKGRSCAAY